MACEVICCEVTAMIDIIVEAKNGELMNRLFSMITREELIQNRLAGYFEKTLQVLFKRFFFPISPLTPASSPLHLICVFFFPLSLFCSICQTLCYFKN